MGYNDGVTYEEYYRWLLIVYAITVLELPVITIPMGKTESGMPMGVPLVGQHGKDEKLFSFASYIVKLLDLDWFGKPVS